MFALEVIDLHKAYLKTSVLKGVNFSVAVGENFGFAGVNGAGKSTFLKCLLDFCHYDQGQIKVFNQSSRNRLARSRLAFLPERFIPPYYLTGEQFLKMVLKLQGSVYKRDKALQIFSDVDLEQSALAKPVRSFSKGMTQKLGLIACFMAERDFYIFDEPMSGLDPKARALVKRQFQRLRERGATLFFTSHALADIEEVCSRLAVLHDGTIRYVGSPNGMREQFNHAPNLEEAYLQAITLETKNHHQNIGD